MIIKERKLAVGLRMFQIPQGAFFTLGQLPGDKVLFNRSTVPHFSMVGDKILGPFQNYPHSLQRRKIQPATASCLKDPLGGFISDAGYFQKILIGGFGDFYGKKLQMSKRPVTFRIQKDIKIRPGRTEKIVCLKSIIS